MRYRDLIETIIKPRKPQGATTTRKPAPPMTPAEGRREADRRAGVQDRLRDERRRHAEKVRDLQSKLTPTR